MSPKSQATLWLFVLFTMAGCSSTEITEHQPYEGEKLARPDRMIVHDFIATPADVSPDSAFAAELAGADGSMTTEQIEAGRKLGAEVAKALVANLRDLGLPAVQAEGQAVPRVHDIVLRGYFVSIDEGSSTKRVLIGFGSGAAELRTAVEGYQMTAEGLRLLGSGKVDSGGDEMPGVMVPLAVLAATANPIAGEASGSDTIEGAAKRTADEIAAQIQKTAKKQGWI